MLNTTVPDGDEGTSLETDFRIKAASFLMFQIGKWNFHQILQQKISFFLFFFFSFFIFFAGVSIVIERESP